jgi:hypothetical protein
MSALRIGRLETLWQMGAGGSPEAADGIEESRYFTRFALETLRPCRKARRLGQKLA